MTTVRSEETSSEGRRSGQAMLNTPHGHAEFISAISHRYPQADENGMILYTICVQEPLARDFFLKSQK